MQFYLILHLYSQTTCSAHWSLLMSELIETIKAKMAQNGSVNLTSWKTAAQVGLRWTGEVAPQSVHLYEERNARERVLLSKDPKIENKYVASNADIVAVCLWYLQIASFFFC